MAGAAPPVFAFVLPLVHPEGPKVTDYGVVETALEASLTSYLAQEGAEVRVVLVGHRRPGFLGRFGERAVFLDLGDHPGFAAGRNTVQVDKGMKYVLGILHAIHGLGAGHVMPADADDYAHGRLAARAMAREAEGDGAILTRGLHALVHAGGDGLVLDAVFEIDAFDMSCGTCRIFRAGALLEAIGADLPDLAGADPVGDGAVRRDILDALVAAGDRVGEDLDTVIHTLGRHVWQERRFDLMAWPEALVAKACGHGNHDGHRGGDVHWFRIRRRASRRGFLRDFGLGDGPLRRGPVDWRAEARGTVSALKRRFGAR